MTTMQQVHVLLIIAVGAITVTVCSWLTGADQQTALQELRPLSPREELATFRLPKGLRAELVACEPDVVDPVAIAFDEEGRLYVAEMRGYPNGGIGKGQISSGKIKLLEDRDGDGFYEHSTTFADGLRFPTSVMPWKGGLLVAVAPDIVFFEDRDGDGQAEYRRTLYTGFGLDNIQQMINGLQWGLDNWVHGCAGINPSSVRSLEKPELPLVTLRNRGVRFQPERPGSLEPTSGGGQFGLAADDWETWFTNTNNQHLRHIVVPDHYLRRNPSLSVDAVTLDIPDHDAACKVFRISPFEPWRVERTRRRKEAPDSRRYPSTELVPGGYITSACSPVVYTAGLLPECYRGNTFICDPANNLVHRDTLDRQGATFTAHRPDSDCEFLASTDNWFRPVNLTIGPDGALYVVDFYREVIETPLSLPEDIKKRLNLESRGRGRIWRIVPEGFQQPRKPSLRKAPIEELVRHLDEVNVWWRLTAQRLLVERKDAAATEPLKKLVGHAKSPQGRVHALWTLHALNALEDGLIEQALKDPEPRIRIQGLRLSEEHVAKSAALRTGVLALADDPAPEVRFQAAFTLGEIEDPAAVAALGRIARQDVSDPWTQIAVLSSSGRTAASLLVSLARSEHFSDAAGARQLLNRLANLVGARAQESELVQSLQLLTTAKAALGDWRTSVLEGLGQGMQNTQRPMSEIWQHGPPVLQKALAPLRTLFKEAAARVEGNRATTAERIAAARLLGYGPFSIASKPLATLLDPHSATELQLTSIRALSLHKEPKVAEILLAPWRSYSPSVRREVLEAVFARSERLPALLNAIEQKTVLASQLEAFRIEQLRKNPDRHLRERALRLLSTLTGSDRQKVVESYRSALQLPGDVGRGKSVFGKICSTCHRLENVGTEVGPNLLSALLTKTRETLLVDILDPSREVDPRFINYMVFNKAGRVFTGMIAVETASSLTLRRAEGAEDTILRSQIDEIQGTAKSLMPDNLELQLSKQDVADVIAYLQSVASPK
jgi:putative membrane-bound dehydrogenase-like protein